MLQKEFNILLIEYNPQKETELMRKISTCVPEGIRLKIHWVRHMCDGLCRLIDRRHPYNYDMVIINEGPDADELCSVLRILDLKVCDICKISPPSENATLEGCTYAGSATLQPFSGECLAALWSRTNAKVP